MTGAGLAWPKTCSRLLNLYFYLNLFFKASSFICRSPSGNAFHFSSLWGLATALAGNFGFACPLIRRGLTKLFTLFSCFSVALDGLPAAFLSS